MGLLDQVFGGLMGGSGGASPIQGVLMNMLGGGQQSGTGLAGQSGGMGGGLSGLVSSF